jgi:hypothetical protein
VRSAHSEHRIPSCFLVGCHSHDKHMGGGNKIDVPCLKGELCVGHSIIIAMPPRHVASAPSRHGMALRQAHGAHMRCVVIQCPSNPHVYVTRSNIAGAGLGAFAATDLPACTQLGEYLGRRSRNILDSSSMYIFTVSERPPLHIDAAYPPYNDASVNPLAFVNGCITPAQQRAVNVNSYVEDSKILFELCEDVTAGTELLLDYGPSYWPNCS